VFSGDGSVNLRRCQFRVAEQVLDGPQIGTAFEEVMLGKKSPQDALNEAVQTIESKYLKAGG